MGKEGEKMTLLIRKRKTSKQRTKGERGKEDGEKLQWDFSDGLYAVHVKFTM